jgi:hypothetical protein
MTDREKVAGAEAAEALYNLVVVMEPGPKRTALVGLVAALSDSYGAPRLHLVQAPPAVTSA